MKRKLIIISAVLFSAVFLLNCGIPFDVTTTQQTLEVPNTGGTYFETVIPIPAEAKDPGITYDSVTVFYTVRKTDPFAANVDLYASSDQTADNAKDPSDELLIGATLTTSETETSGSTASAEILEALNNQQDNFVMGADNSSVGQISSVFVDITVNIKGTYSPF